MVCGAEGIRRGGVLDEDWGFAIAECGKGRGGYQGNRIPNRKAAKYELVS